MHSNPNAETIKGLVFTLIILVMIGLLIMALALFAMA